MAMPLALDDKDFLDAGCTERAFDSLNSARDKYAQDRVLTSKASSSKSFLEASFYESFYLGPRKAGTPQPFGYPAMAA